MCGVLTLVFMPKYYPHPPSTVFVIVASSNEGQWGGGVGLGGGCCPTVLDLAALSSREVLCEWGGKGSVYRRKKMCVCAEGVCVCMCVCQRERRTHPELIQEQRKVMTPC